MVSLGVCSLGVSMLAGSAAGAGRASPVRA
jgi:hypothetical protein